MPNTTTLLAIREVLDNAEIPDGIKLSMIQTVTNTEPATPDCVTNCQGIPACPKCKGHTFRIEAQFSGTVDILFKADEDFEVEDSEPGDSEWDHHSHAECIDCDWFGPLAAAYEAATPEEDDNYDREGMERIK